jgi:hypothetical protein
MVDLSIVTLVYQRVGTRQKIRGQRDHGKLHAKAFTRNISVATSGVSAFFQ